LTAGAQAAGLADLRPMFMNNNDQNPLMDSCFKASLIANIDKLREAVEKNDVEEIHSSAQQISLDCQSISGSPSFVESIIEPIQNLIFLECPPKDPPSIVSNNNKFNKLLEDLKNIRSFMLSLANGDLSQDLTLRGYLAGVLKMFQSNLRHLTWQTQKVAKGDFTQRIQFMGDFATSFNSMVLQLDTARKELLESEENYRLLATTDPLTGLSNRRDFFEAAYAEFFRAERYNKDFTIFMIDVDHFKKVNDNYGHAAGDLVIMTVAELVRQELRDSDHPARYGGEEFIVLLPETNIIQAGMVAERIRISIENKKIYYKGIEINVTASFGIAAKSNTDVPHSANIFSNPIDEIIDKADKALYKAKTTGRNKVMFSVDTLSHLQKVPSSGDAVTVK
jgi:diguanylate cyclase (GGDEF)-like protein